MSAEHPMGDFEICVTPLRREMVLLARKLTGNIAQADDVVQDSMLRAWRAWPTWAPSVPDNAEGCLRGWLIRIVTNTFGNHYQHNKSKMKMYSCADEVIEGSHGQSPASPSGIVEREMSDEVSEALAAAHPERRDVILLFAAGFSYNEIAETMSTPVGTVMSRLFRARTDFGERLAAYAACEYGIGPMASGRARRAREDEPGFEPVQELETEADGIQDVMGDADDVLSLSL